MIPYRLGDYILAAPLIREFDGFNGVVAPRGCHIGRSLPATHQLPGAGVQPPSIASLIDAEAVAVGLWRCGSLLRKLVTARQQTDLAQRQYSPTKLHSAPLKPATLAIHDQGQAYDEYQARQRPDNEGRCICRSRRARLDGPCGMRRSTNHLRSPISQ